MGFKMKKQWWHEKVAYQIYPKSFCDANGDGVGDIQGIISKLDYLKELGIDIIWISPMYQSPFIDQGYDISDYYAIDPVFGSMEDMEQLLSETKKRNMYLLMDLVVNHCSSQHEWFQKALQDPEGEYGDYFYIREGKDGGVPCNCNWRSYFGGSVWEKIPGTNKYYLHMFAKEQPDLNWENPVVRHKIYDMINWWLDKGLAGFRIDAIVNIKKDLSFSSMPPDREDGLCACSKMLKKVRGVEEFLQEMNQETFQKNGAFSIAELFDYDENELEKYIGDGGCFSSIFDFSTEGLGRDDRGWTAFQSIAPNEYRDTIYASQLRTGNRGFMANIFENHDEPRGVSHYIPEGECCEESKKLLALLLFMIKGLPFLYQGQEIGMENNQFTCIEELNDIHTIESYRIALEEGYTRQEAMELVNKYSRDNARTPMQWNDSENAGFTTGKPWLCVNQNYEKINVEEQSKDADSVLNFYKRLINLRKNDRYKEAIVYGDLELTDKQEDQQEDQVFSFYRRGEENTLLVLGNFQNKSVKIRVSDTIKEVILNTHPTYQLEKNEITLLPYQGLAACLELC